MEIIWNKNELINIKKIILNRLNHKLDKNNNLIKNETVIIGYGDSGSINNNLYTDLLPEFKELFYIKDKKQILDILSLIKKPTFNKDNPLHFGLISCISKIDIESIKISDDYTYIFEILKELASQYERVISNTAKKIAEEEVNEKIKEIIIKINNSDNDTEELIFIKNTMNNILNCTNLDSFDIFNKVIIRYNNNLKEKLLHYLNLYYKKKIYTEDREKSYDSVSHIKDFKYKYQRKHMDKIKEHHQKFYF